MGFVDTFEPIQLPMNLRQFHIFFNQAKTWHWIVCWFLCIYLFLPVFAWYDHKIVLFGSAEQYHDHIMQKLVKTGKNIKQAYVKLWLKLNRICSCILLQFLSTHRHSALTQLPNYLHSATIYKQHIIKRLVGPWLII